MDMTDTELAEAYEQQARICGEWVREAREKEKALLGGGDIEGAKAKQRLISGLNAQKKQLLADAARLRGGPPVGSKPNRVSTGGSSPPRGW